jgi:Tol biopolymer transport system component
MTIATCMAAAAISASAQETTRVSVDSAGGEGDHDSTYTFIAANGRIVAFTSDATNLVAADTNGAGDVFVHDRTTGTTERVSVDSSGVEANGFNYVTSISADGRIVAFTSDATNLVALDLNHVFDCFLHDRTTGSTERVSVGASGQEGNGSSGWASLSANGGSVAFTSLAANLVTGDVNFAWDVFVRDRIGGTTRRMSVDSSGAEGNGASLLAALSADGNVVAFESSASNLVASDNNGMRDLFVHDRTTGVTERVSVDSSGAEGDDDSGYFAPSLSADGRIVAFVSTATNLVANDTNGFLDVFVHDRTTGITERVSVDSSGAEGDDDSSYPVLSADGRLVAFQSGATNLVANDTNATTDIFVHDRATGVTERVSVDSAGAEEDSYSGGPSLTPDGTLVAFYSTASNLVANDSNGSTDVFVHELCWTSASWSNYGAGFPGTNGIPALTAQQNPAFGATLTIDLANSYAKPTTGLLFVGFQRASLHSSFGGDLLLVPALTLFVTFSYGGDSFTGTIPNDYPLCGVAIDLQAIEADPGAARGVSFTPGLELILGR